MAGNKEAFQKAMNQGHSAAWDQDWDKAASFYSAALKEFPDHPQALSSLGLAFFENQDFPASLKCYQKAAVITPEDPICREKIARIFERMGNLNDAVQASLQAAELHLKARSVDKSIDNWMRVLSIQPENISVRSRLAAVYEKLGRREEAIAEFISTASILQRSGDIARAIKAIEYALKIMPENQEVRLALRLVRNNQPLPRPSKVRGGTGPVQMSKIREMGGEHEGAGGESLDPVAEARKKALVQLAGLLFDQAEESSTASAQPRARGLSALTRGIADPNNDSSDRARITLHLGQAIDSQTHGENNQSVVELEHALNLGLRQPAAYYLLGLLLKDTNSEKCLKYLQQAVKHPDYSMASNLLFAQLYEKDGQWNEAATSYLQALALADVSVVEPELADELLGQYDAIIDSQSSIEEPEVLKATCKAVASQLNRPKWRSLLVQARQNLSQSSENMSITPVAELVLETRNSHVAETMVVVRQLASQGKIHTAIEEALYALQYAPTYLPLHVLIGDLLLQDERTIDAIQKYLVIAELYTVRGEVIRAVRLLKRVSQLMPTDVGVRQRLIEMLVAQDKVDEALTEYTSLADLYYSFADLDKARSTSLEALKVAQKSKENRKWGVGLLLKVADIDMQRLNLRQALRIYEQIRTIQPDHLATRSQIVGLNFRLGQDATAMKECDEYVSYLENTSNRSQAVDFIKDLLVDYANQTDLRRRLADLYLHSGNQAEAVVQLDAVADALLSANQHMEAVNLLETIVSLNPPNVQEYRSAIDSLRRSMLRK